MLKINLYPKFEGRPCPAVSYHHYMINGPMKIFKYKWFPTTNKRAIVIFAKFMAMIHDYILCYDNELGIQYGIYYIQEEKPL